VWNTPVNQHFNLTHATANLTITTRLHLYPFHSSSSLPSSAVSLHSQSHTFLLPARSLYSCIPLSS
jgi:hypothetical protein